VPRVDSHGVARCRRPPAHIRAKTEARGDAGIQGRHRETGHRGRDDQVDVARLKSRLGERTGHRLAAQVDCVLDEQVVRVAEIGQRYELLERQHGVATVDLRAFV
jgi:hypothetical protein